jgi:hypothetical protein
MSVGATVRNDQGSLHKLQMAAGALLFACTTTFAWAESPQRDCGPPELSMEWLSQLPQATPAVQRARARVFAEAGVLWSQCSLGTMLAEGFGGPADRGESAQWLKRAALRGQAYAQFHLGVLLSAGDGVARDDAEALVWLALAILGPADEPTRAAAQAVHDFVLIRVRAQETAQAQQTALSSEVMPAASAASALPALNQRTPTATTQSVMRPMTRPLGRPILRPMFRPIARAPLRVMPRPSVKAPLRSFARGGVAPPNRPLNPPAGPSLRPRLGPPSGPSSPATQPKVAPDSPS